MAVAGAPTRQVLRPGDLDDAQLHRDMQQEAIFGTQHGVQANVTGNSLAIRQPGAEIALDEQGSIRVSLPARDTAGRRPFAAGIASIVEEDVRDRIISAIRYCGWLLDRVDPAHRLSQTPPTPTTPVTRSTTGKTRWDQPSCSPMESSRSATSSTRPYRCAAANSPHSPPAKPP